MLETALIYPFNSEVAFLANYNELLRGIQIKKLVSPKGWCFSDDVYDVNGSRLIATSCFEESIQECSLVWFVDSREPLSFEEFILPKLKLAIKQNKKILYTRKLGEEKFVVKDLLKTAKCLELNSEPYVYFDTEEIFHIKTPVVFVCGIFEGLGKYDVQLSLRKEFLKRNYKLLQIGTKLESQLFGFMPIPSFMFDENVSTTMKTILFNHFIRKKEIEESPDIIIIGIPGELFPLSTKLVGNFGIHAYNISNAVAPDCSILCLPFDQYKDEDYYKIQNLIFGRFGIEIDYYSISKKLLDVYNSELKKKFCYLSLSNEFVIENLNIEKSNDIFCLSDEYYISELTNKIISSLSDFARVHSF